MPLSMEENLYCLLQQRALNGPADLGLEMVGGRTVSYADLDNGSARIAKLFQELCLAPGDRVLVQVDKSPQAVMLYLGCLRAGMVYVPLNTAYTAAELSYFLSDSEPRLVVCSPHAADQIELDAVRSGAPRVLTMDEQGGGTLMEQAGTLPPKNDIVSLQSSDLGAILYTSGTTGRSKGAMLSHGNLSSNALALHRIWGWIPGDVLIHALPIFHVHGLFVALHTAMLNASRILFLPRFDADKTISLLPRATVMMGVPTFYTRLLQNPALTRDVCRNMRLFISGSAPLLKETFESFETRTGHRILERYGMTEAGMITSNPLDGERLPETVGFPLPDVMARVTDEQGRAVGIDEVGVLEIKGPNVFRGYWRAPEKTKAEFCDDGYFGTGDLVRMDQEGRISVVGRVRDLIISGGYNVYPKEVEVCIDSLDGVVESAVVGIPHPDFGEGVVGFVVLHRHANVSEQSVKDALADSLAKFKIPKRLFFVDELPRNTMGKVQKNLLRERHSSIFRTSGS
jgi:malonyl-CoA/methylmalonyl-CoA synthetase